MTRCLKPDFTFYPDPLIITTFVSYIFFGQFLPRFQFLATGLSDKFVQDDREDDSCLVHEEGRAGVQVHQGLHDGDGWMGWNGDQDPPVPASS